MTTKTKGDKLKIMSMENGGGSKSSEAKSEKEILLDNILNLKNTVKNLRLTITALLTVLAINSDLGKKLSGNEENRDSVPVSQSFENLDGTKVNSFSYTLQDVEGLLEDLDKQVLMNKISEEQIKTLKMIIKNDEEYIKTLNTNPDGGTIETGGPVIGSEQTDEQLKK